MRVCAWLALLYEQATYLADQVCAIGFGGLHCKILHQMAWNMRGKVQVEAVILASTTVFSNGADRVLIGCYKVQCWHIRNRFTILMQQPGATDRQSNQSINQPTKQITKKPSSRSIGHVNTSNNNNNNQAINDEMDRHTNAT
jgi:hypothetical protein